ncbi:MAG TPA: hydroxymethylglutaryl-CoA lyase [Terracidiphilus sp.]|nr:hydroxymethylglutaryl-CoA lyase [Terracidiphilus sp.]
MTDTVKIVECPRDAWQGLAAHIPAEAKASYLRKLIAAGFTHIDAVSFVSPTAVPQMADSEHVLALLDPPPNVEIIGIVVNEKGAERAIHTGRVQTLGFPYSISPEFLRRNQKQTAEEALHVLGVVTELAEDAGRNVVAYVSMAFGNPYGDEWSADAVVRACKQIIGLGIWQISLADTVGAATTSQITATVSAAIEASEGAQIGVHLHARRNQAAAHIRAAYEAGCRRFDAAIGGLGGCPFAQDDLVANIPTEILIEELTRCGAQLPQIAPLDELIGMSGGFTQS